MASMKRELANPNSDEPEVKKSKTTQRVVLNPADCDLDFNIEGNGLQGFALHEQGFAYCWSGARANVGISRGKYCFGCKIISAQPVVMEDTPIDQQHLCRLGISRGDDSAGNLGETEHSFGFGGTGKSSTAGKYSDYGERFGVGDTIVCSVNLENKPLAFIGFSKNGKWLGTAKHFNTGSSGLGVVDSQIRRLPWESAFFPNVLLKNVVVVLQFSLEDGLVPEEGYKPWACALEDGNAITGPIFSNPRDCELMMMVGLPASGKSTWAEKWVKEHPEKRYVLLGTNLALDQMKVPGLLRKNNYGERFDRLMDCATGIFNTLLSRAAKTPRNYIIDQTNVYKSARKRKLKPFADYQKIAVVVFPEPEELKSRADKRFKEMGKDVPAEAVNEMLANFVLPMSKDMPSADEFFDQVIFTELNRGESQKRLDEMKHALACGANVHPRSVSPYSRESSVQSYNSFSMQNRETFSGYSTCDSVSRGHRQSCYPPHPRLNYDHQSPGQVNSAYFGGGPPGRMDCPALTNQGNQSPVPNDPSYRSYDGYECDHSRRNEIESRIANPGFSTDSYRTPMLNDAYQSYGGYEYDRSRRNDVENRISNPGVNSAYFGVGRPGRMDSLSLSNQANQIPPALNDPYRSYGGYDYSRRDDIGSRSSIPWPGADCYQTSGVDGSSNHPNIESSKFIPGSATSPYRSGMVEPYARPSSRRDYMDSLSVSNQGKQTPPALNDPYLSYGGYDHSRRDDVGSRSPVPGPGTDYYRTSGVGGSSNHLNVESSNFIPGGATGPYHGGMAEPYARPSSSNYDERASFPGRGVSQADLQASRHSPFLPSGPSTTYGSPYGTPVARRLRMETFPADTPDARGYGPPRPTYY
ncbi:Heterogeneous nuclear ribonucleoprotein U-like protein [Actinidia chinensis var. chinensis]|uniref:Heterogeneous nuclear ribonucleoprotein U-like protein n=1 Tax=Actinidia chinensis var. chinensis TaxID=1590841 RepID=A0A2R6QA22_ACTCC|nr:Heterogeneous nuclear ribonucleoprotein U-like protein [Actinidia chinensis var. chinensis]